MIEERADLVLLDLDGVLMDHRAAARAAVVAWLGPRATPEVLAAWFAAQDRRLGQWRSGELTWAEQRRARMRDVLPVLGEAERRDEELDLLFERGYLPAYERAWAAFPDAAPAVEELRRAGVALAVLTNGSEQQQRAKLRAIGLLDRVGPMFTAEALGARKPDPRAFLTVCERLSVRPGRTLHIGDEHEVDVLGARAAGLQAVLLDRDETAPQQEAAVIRGLAEVRALMVPSGR